MASRSLIPEVWKVPVVFRQRLRESVGRQRAMFADGHLLLLLHAPPKADEPQRSARVFWRSPDGTWQSTMGPGIASLQRHLAEFHALLERLDDLEDLADRAQDFLAILQEIAPLRRTARNLHETLQQAREMVPDDSELILCRDQAYAMQRRAELVESDTQSGLQCAVARRAEEQAQSSQRMATLAHRLNVMAALFFPIATLATVFGMNLRHGMEITSFDPWPFWIVLGTGLFVGLLFKGALLEPAAKARPNEPVNRFPGPK